MRRRHLEGGSTAVRTRRRSVYATGCLAAAALLGGGIGLVAVLPASAATSLGTWSTTGSLAGARFDATSTLLPSGDVLVAGGMSGSGASAVPVATAELYNPSGSFSSTGSMTTARADATSNLLPNGDVLIAGGLSGTTSLAPVATAELYDPTKGTFSATGSMPVAVYGASSVSLSNGDVLVIGGDTGSPTSTATTHDVELYNATSGTWTALGSLSTARAFATATLLQSGDVLVTGGVSGTGASAAPVASSELYDPTKNTWTSAGDLSSAVAFQSATLLADGDVLVAGGETGSGVSAASTNLAELYNPNSGSTGSWSTTGSLGTAREDATATLLADGDVLIAGGTDVTAGAGTALSSSELYDPSSGTFTSTGSLTTARFGAHATLMSSGEVLVTGGETGSSTPIAMDGTAISSSELYDAGIPPSFTSASTANFTETIAASFSIATSASPTATITEQGVLPSGLSFTADTDGTATISGTATTTGTYTVKLIANNGVGSPVIQLLSIVVTTSPVPGYALAEKGGTVIGYGTADSSSAVSTSTTARPVVAIVANSSVTGSYYLVTNKGNVYNEGGAPFYGSPASSHTKLAQPIAAFAVMPNGAGYWLATKSGTVYAYGAAATYGSVSVSAKTRPVVGMASTPDGKGYWLATSLGNVYNEGDAGFYGSKANARLPHLVVAIAATTDGKGYDLVSSGGNLYNFGSAKFFGSKATSKLPHPVVGLALSLDDNGYLFVTSGGNVYNFGDAGFYGSPVHQNLSSAIASVTVLS